MRRRRKGTRGFFPGWSIDAKDDDVPDYDSTNIRGNEDMNWVGDDATRLFDVRGKLIQLCKAAGYPYAFRREKPCPNRMFVWKDAGFFQCSAIEDYETLLSRGLNGAEFIPDSDAVWLPQAKTIVGTLECPRELTLFVSITDSVTLEAPVGANHGSIEFAPHPIVAGDRDLIPLALNPTGMGPTVSVNDVKVSSLSEARALFISLTDSLCFQLYSLTGSNCFRASRETVTPDFANDDSEEPSGLEGIGYPRQRYDPVPMALFQHGLRSADLETVAFLSFYQVLEFYFSHYTEKETLRRLGLVCRDPRFRPDDTAQLLRLLQTSRGGWSSSGPSELEQLRCTIGEVLPVPSELARFLRELSGGDQKVFGRGDEFFSAPQVPLKEADQEIIAKLSARIYDIRCRIVHAKGSFDGTAASAIVQAHPDIRRLSLDIEVLQWLAERALIAASH